MGEEAEYLSEQEDYSDLIDEDEQEERAKRIDATKLMLTQKSNRELLEYLCDIGPKLNTLSTFKTYDIAKRLKDNNWTPTAKQRDALINSAAIAINTNKR